MSSGGGEEMVANGEMGRGREEEERRGAGGDEVFAAAASATGSSRHGSIMRASGQCCIYCMFDIIDTNRVLRCMYSLVVDVYYILLELSGGQLMGFSSYVTLLPSHIYVSTLVSLFWPGMSTTDRSAATRARHKVRATTVRGRHRRRGTDRDTDDETNEGQSNTLVRIIYYCGNKLT